MTRRTFLAGCSLALKASASPRLPIHKAVLFSMLPSSLSIPDRFQLARDTGFEQTECGTTDDERQAEEMLAASKKMGVRIHSVMNRDHWRYPLTARDPEVVAKCVAGMKTSFRNASLWGADTVLLVPGVVNAETTYQEAWDRSQAQIRKMIPLAEELKVIIAVEEVWNKFLLSPLEFARFIDQFQSPWVRAYFDVGNVVISGYPQDWIRTLGKRIVKLHLKDFTFKQDPNLKKRVADFVMLREGEIDWKEVYRALAEIGYSGSATVELPAGDKSYLEDVSRRVDLIFNGQ
ncbi:MAG TPA: sugar phosphate isomerase/epimerase family protein [Bryobacteraceae bacterium]|nr:sugar phosphate isomerase/epimerase family protein [Bryobacteraceae bacterium]